MKIVPKFLPGGKTLYPIYDDNGHIIKYVSDKATRDSLIYLGGHDMDTFSDLEAQGAGRISKDGMTWIPNRNSVYYGGTEPLNNLNKRNLHYRFINRKETLSPLSKPLPKSALDNFIDGIRAFFTKPSKKKEGGIMKGQNDLDTSNINFSNIDFSKIYEKVREKFSPKLTEIQEKIGPGTDVMTKYDFIEVPKPKLSPRNPRNTGKYGLLSKRKTLLNNQSEIISGEKLINSMPIGYNTAPRLKKGGKLK